MKRFQMVILLFLAIVTSFPLSKAVAAPGDYLSQWGADGLLNGPSDLAIGANGNIYVADFSNNLIQVFDNNGGFLTNWSTDGPLAVAISPNEQIYVLRRHQVQVYDTSGNLITQWMDGQFYYPSDLAFDASGNLYVVDSWNNRIQVFDANGNFITLWYVGFSRPQGIAIGADGKVYVTDYLNDLVHVFDNNGNFITNWGITGSGNGQFDHPVSIEVDTLGKLYVADTWNNRVQVYDSSGVFINQVGSLGSGDGQFNTPGGIGIDASNKVYVTDQNNNRIQVFEGFYIPELTIAITTADYTKAKGPKPANILVEATSLYGVNANLVLDTYNVSMEWDAARSLWWKLVEPVNADPVTITVSGPEGQVSANTY